MALRFSVPRPNSFVSTWIQLALARPEAVGKCCLMLISPLLSIPFEYLYV